MLLHLVLNLIYKDILDLIITLEILKRMCYMLDGIVIIQKELCLIKLFTDNNGKYKEGGLIRFALFLGNSKVFI